MQPGKLAALFAAVAVIAFAASAGAVDGTIEINQAKVIAAGGFPYVISASGSYRLTGNLTDSSTSFAAISVTAANVTIDLNGFTITGPGGGLGSTTGRGIDGFTAVALTVENGTVTKFGGEAGIRTGNNGIVRNVHVSANGLGIVTGNGSVISGNTANDNNGTGIACSGSGCVISGNTAVNQVDGIGANDATTAYGGNVLNKNTLDVSGGTSLKNNVCSGVLC
jgi:parallel beta-helix repeat protein